LKREKGEVFREGKAQAKSGGFDLAIYNPASSRNALGGIRNLWRGEQADTVIL